MFPGQFGLAWRRPPLVQLSQIEQYCIMQLLISELSSSLLPYAARALVQVSASLFPSSATVHYSAVHCVVGRRLFPVSFSPGSVGAACPVGSKCYTWAIN
jgi:hypothetical protein